MCQLCLLRGKGQITIKEGLNAVSEMVNTMPKEKEAEKEHLEAVRTKLLSEYADEISAEVMRTWRSR